MGMKVKQESRVKTFFKKLFKLSRRKNKDGWDSRRLEEDISLDTSGDSNLDISVDSNIIRRDSNIIATPEKTTNNSDLNKIPIENNKSQLRKSKRWQLKLNLKATRLIEVDDYERINDDVASESTADLFANNNKKKNKKEKNKKEKSDPASLDNASPLESPEQELIDVDLDLVLASFQSLHSASLQRSMEADDNRANERLALQTPAMSRQVEAVIESRDYDIETQTLPEKSDQQKVDVIVKNILPEKLESEVTKKKKVPTATLR